MYAAGTATKFINSFDPRALGSCILWLDAADANTITFNTGSNVETWTDKGPMKVVFRRAAQGSTATSSPQYNATGKFIYFNNNYSHLISGASQGLQAPSTNTGFTIPSISESCSIYTVHNILNGTNTNYNPILYFDRYQATPKPNIVINVFANTASALNSGLRSVNFAYNSNAPFSFERDSYCVYDTMSTNSTVLLGYVGTRFSTTVWFSGVQKGTDTTSFTPSANGSISTLYLQVGAGNYNFCYTGYIHEILYFNAQHTNAQRQAVEGYLAWKWGLTNSLPFDHPYKTTFPVLRNLTPLDMPVMPTLWFDATNNTTIASNTSNVTTWSNSGVYTCNAISNVAGSNTFRTGINSQNGLNVLNAPANGHMTIPATIFTNQARSLFCAHKLTGSITSGDYYSWIGTSNTLGNGWLHIMYNIGGTTYRHAFHKVGVGDQMYFDTTQNPLNNFYQVALIQDTSTMNNVGTWNGSTMGLSVTTAASYTLNEPHLLGSTKPYTWDAGDIILYNMALQQSQREQVEGYLSWKWGITSLLPFNHPYKLTRPLSLQFNPRFLSNCLFWYDAADASYITSNTSNVVTWSNKGIYPQAAVSNASYLTGRTGINTINGLNVVNFPVGAQMHISNVSTAQQARSCFVVSRNLTELNGANIYQGYLNPGDATGLQWQNLVLSYDSGTSSYIVTLGANAIGVYSALRINSSPLNNVNMYALINDTSTAGNAATYNGSTMTLIYNAAASGYKTTNINFANFGTAGYNTAQDMAEYIQYDYALPQSDRYRVEGYLAWKWGIASSLPSYHPYRQAPP